MIINNVQCYDYNGFLEKVFKPKPQYSDEIILQIKNCLSEYCDVNNRKSLGYFELTDDLQRLNYPSSLINKKIKKYFDNISSVEIHKELETYEIKSNNSNEVILIMFFYTQQYHCCIFVITDDIIKTLDNSLYKICDIFHADVSLYLPELNAMNKLYFLNSPPYFDIEKIKNTTLEQGEYVVLDRDYYNEKLLTFITETVHLDHNDNYLKKSLFKVKDKRFFNYIKLHHLCLYSYRVYGEKFVIKVG